LLPDAKDAFGAPKLPPPPPPLETIPGEANGDGEEPPTIDESPPLPPFVVLVIPALPEAPTVIVNTALVDTV
jgi:hypothetical protein